MKIWNRILVFSAYMVGLIASGINACGLNEYKNEIIIGLLIIVVVDYSISTIYVFRKYTLLQTKYDIILRTVNLIVGFTTFGFFLKNINHLFDYGWILLLFGFLGLTSGIVYQNSIQLRKKGSELIINYKHRNKKTLEELHSVILKDEKIILEEHERIIEISDLKNTDSNRKMINEFFNKYYPDIQLKRE